MENTKIIPYEGSYWWSDSQNVTSVLEEELKNILERTRIYSIKITGSDFNDGRENHNIEIIVSNNKIEIKKDGVV